ncbi:MAG: DNA polymerase III subunit beta [Chloroflexi bacterium]|nr:MAG: DNA polymerase III subunit beta [Chloroflexota bacterium]RLC91326.1 MAG: DNA polymerase III subunit beta [Chloroflexota bacterium]HEY67832.1 DNA polymerase III subunit beta [Thermoflexia bacterium]
MKVSCLQENLAKGLSIIGRAVSPRSTLPVLGNVLLATDAGRLKLSATNLEIGINCWIGAKVEDEGAITVPARTFIDLVNALPPERVDMELIVRTQTLNLRAGRSEANIKGIDAQEFPIVPVPEGEGGIPVEPDVLRTAISQVTFAAATDESRPILTGVLAKFEDAQLTLAAADGFRLSVRTVSLPQSVSDPFNIIIPARALVELGRISGEQKEPIVIIITPTRNQVLFQLTDVVLVSQLIDGNFPDYRQIIPRDYTTHTVVDTAAFLKACKTALIFARDAAHITRLHIKPGTELAPGSMLVSATSAETGDDVSELDASIEGDEIEIAFNVKYLIDVLSVVGTPQVALDTTTPSSPGVIRPVGDLNFTHVIMPMHLGR